jgi:ribosomal protein L37AE/L43A
MDFIPIQSFDNYITAHIWLNKLEDAGIDCYLKDEYTVTIDPMLSNAIGGIKLCVATHHLEEAKNLIEQILQETKVKQQCPKCNSYNVQYIIPTTPTNIFTAIISWSVASFAVTKTKVYHCNNCQHEFKELPND